MADWRHYLFLAFPIGLFVFFGLLTFVFRKIRGPRVAADPVDRPLSTNARSGRGGLILFGAIFSLAGLAFFFFMAVRPAYQALRAQSWPHTSGTVISSEVKTRSGDKGSTYSVDIHYRYAVHGATLEGDRYNTMPGSSGGKAGKQKIVELFPPGKHVDVFYNPADASDALLSTAIPSEIYFLMWFPLIFVVVGGVIIMAGLRSGRAVAPKPISSRANFSGGTQGGGRSMIADRSSATTDSRGLRRKNFIGISVFAVFWNGIITFMLFASGGSWCLVPFLIIGVAIAAGAIYAGLALFNPTVRLSFSRMPIRPGDQVDVTYDIDGNFLAIQTLNFHLEGRESVTYQQGTNTRTEHKVVWKIPLLETTQKASLQRGKLIVKMPAGAMPTFKGRHNKFTWQLCCRGDIPRRPNIKDDFEIEVISVGMPS